MIVHTNAPRVRSVVGLRVDDLDRQGPQRGLLPGRGRPRRRVGLLPRHRTGRTLARPTGRRPRPVGPGRSRGLPSRARRPPPGSSRTAHRASDPGQGARRDVECAEVGLDRRGPSATTTPAGRSSGRSTRPRPRSSSCWRPRRVSCDGAMAEWMCSGGVVWWWRASIIGRAGWVIRTCTGTWSWPTPAAVPMVGSPGSTPASSTGSGTRPKPSSRPCFVTNWPRDPGFGFGRIDRHGVGEIDGVSHKVRRAFSQRRREIEAEMIWQGATTGHGARIASPRHPPPERPHPLRRRAPAPVA